MRAYIVAGLGYGDEGKGVTVDYLTREKNSQLTVRYNGGSQAAHNVITPSGIHHTFHQFGSGTLAGSKTFISRFMLIDPIELDAEAEELTTKGIVDPLKLVTIDPRCTVITPFHRYSNRLREKIRGKDRHGSTGMGVGEARQDELAGMALTVDDLMNRTSDEIFSILNRIKTCKLNEFRDWKGHHYYEEIYDYKIRDLISFYFDILDNVTVATEEIALQNVDTAIFEGSQGVLLDEDMGFAPYNSWTNCTFANADTLLDNVKCDRRHKIGVLRSYHTRHGPGPFVSEEKVMIMDEPHNTIGPYMGDFRVGYFDMVAAKYAISTPQSRPQSICLTHMDRVPGPWVVMDYSKPFLPNAKHLLSCEPVLKPFNNIKKCIEDNLHIPVGMLFHGPTANDGYKNYNTHYTD